MRFNGVVVDTFNFHGFVDNVIGFTDFAYNANRAAFVAAACFEVAISLNFVEYREVAPRAFPLRGNVSENAVLLCFVFFRSYWFINSIAKDGHLGGITDGGDTLQNLSNPAEEAPSEEPKAEDLPNPDDTEKVAAELLKNNTTEEPKPEAPEEEEEEDKKEDPKN